MAAIGWRHKIMTFEWDSVVQIPIVNSNRCLHLPLQAALV